MTTFFGCRIPLMAAPPDARKLMPATRLPAILAPLKLAEAPGIM
jgi:hypothetical protein